MSAPHVEATITLLYDRALQSPIRCQFIRDGENWDADYEFGAAKPGETVTARIRFFSPSRHLGWVTPGTPFLARAGQQDVACGVITRLVSLEQAAREDAPRWPDAAPTPPDLEAPPADLRLAPRPPDALAQLGLLAPTDGGRRAPLTSGQKSQLHQPHLPDDRDCMLALAAPIAPGGRGLAAIWFLSDARDLRPDAPFVLRNGKRIFASGAFQSFTVAENEWCGKRDTR